MEKETILKWQPNRCVISYCPQWDDPFFIPRKRRDLLLLHNKMDAYVRVAAINANRIIQRL